jgi:hypothetical protein
MKTPHFITNPIIDLRDLRNMEVTLIDPYGKQIIGFPVDTPKIGKVRYFILSSLIKLTVWLLVKCMRYPVVSLADKLGGHGFVIVPVGQWSWLNSLRSDNNTGCSVPRSAADLDFRDKNGGKT